MVIRDPKKIVAVSIETTGLSEFDHEIIEIGAVKLTNGVVSERFQALIKPKNEISERVARLTGITNQSVESASGIESVLREFLDFSQDHILVAYGAEFCLRFFRKNANELNLQFDPQWMDLLNSSLFLFPELKKHNFFHLCNHFGIPTDTIHCQADEAKACSQLYRALMGEMEDRRIPADTFYRPISPSIILNHVCKHYGVTEKDLAGSSRRREIVRARWVAMYLLRMLTNENLVAIGKLFNRDHATTLFSIKRVEEVLRQEDNPLDSAIRENLRKMGCVETISNYKNRDEEER